MDSIKTIWTSKTVWGAVIMILPTILAFFGIQISEADVTTGVNHVQAVIDGLLNLIGFIMVIWGRMHAKGQASILPPK